MARMISQYGDVYLRALDWSCSCSSLVSLIRNGLDLGKPVTSAETKSSPEPNVKARTIRHRIYETEYLVAGTSHLAAELENSTGHTTSPLSVWYLFFSRIFIYCAYIF